MILNQQPTSFSLANLTSFHANIDDETTFYAILKMGLTEHTEKYGTRVRVLDLAQDEKGAHIVFYMSLLEATKVQQFHPAFSIAGLMGCWKLSETETTYPCITLSETWDERNVNQFMQLAASAKNPDFIRKRYLV